MKNPAGTNSSLIRDTTHYPKADLGIPQHLLVSEFFSIQWHITNSCDLHCKHCYDRSKRSPLTLTQGQKILNDLQVFCKERGVKGNVCFTGGNPFLSPFFLELYAEAVQKGFSVDVLGNPVTEDQLDSLIRISPPGLFQISMEGLKTYNDSIRGKGSFDRALAFLELLRSLNVPSGVMLTLTDKNMGQVLKLGKLLQGKTGFLTFSRLSREGEGALLEMPSRDRYASFLTEYLKAAEKNPTLSLKDNLFNIILYKNNLPLFYGCVGFGCSPAFNTVAVLCDGEVHACRKFPSLIGNINKRSLSRIYDSTLAKRYRKGNSACAKCFIKPLCGGCMASIKSHGLNIFKDKDPYCFMDRPNGQLSTPANSKFTDKNVSHRIHHVKLD